MNPQAQAFYASLRRVDERQLGATYEQVDARVAALVEKAVGVAPDRLEDGLYAVTSPRGAKLDLALGRIGPDTRLSLAASVGANDARTLLEIFGSMGVSLVIIGASVASGGPPALMVAVIVLMSIAIALLGRRNGRRAKERIRERDVLMHRLLRAFEDEFRDAPVAQYRVAAGSVPAEPMKEAAAEAEETGDDAARARARRV